MEISGGGGCRLRLTIGGGDAQLHVSRLAVRAQVNRQGGLQLGVGWNHTSLPISFLQLRAQLSLFQSTKPFRNTISIFTIFILAS